MNERRYRVEIDRFLAADAEGVEYQIIEYQEMIETEFVGGSVSTTKGLKALKTASGAPVNRIDAETYDIIDYDLRTGVDHIRVIKR
jgi:hypothetical protein